MEKSSRNLEDPRGDSPVVRPVRLRRPWILGAFYAVLLLPLSVTPRISGNVTSRYMTIEAIVERGTLAIESSPLLRGSGSPDLVRFGRHFYSDKPPVLPALGAIVYEGLYLAGIRFSSSPGEFVEANLVLVWTLVGLSSGLTLVALRQLLQTVDLPPWLSDVLTLGFGFGSLLLPYAVTFNNHSVAAALVTVVLALTALEDSRRSRVWKRRFVSGLLAGLAAGIDLPAGGMLLLVLGTWLTLRTRRPPLAFLAGAVLPILAHCGLQSLVTGSPFPAEMYPKAFAYPGSYWATEAGRWSERGPRWQFGLELLFGPQGWLTITPVLAFGGLGVGLVLARRRDPLRGLALAVSAMVSALLVYYIWGVRRTDFAGQSFGTRHLLAVSPACYHFAVAAVDRVRGWLVPPVFAALLVVGTIYAVSGLRNPWRRVESLAGREPAVALLQRVVLYPWSSYRR